MTPATLESLDCLTLNVVLATAFDAHELETLTRGEDVPHDPGCGCGRLDAAYRSYTRAHHLCHGDSETARRIARRLDDLYGDLAVEVAIAPLERVARAVERAMADEGSRAGGLLWALATCRRPDLEPFRSHLLTQVLLRSLRRWAFGPASEASRP